MAYENKIERAIQRNDLRLVKELYTNMQIGVHNVDNNPNCLVHQLNRGWLFALDNNILEMVYYLESVGAGPDNRYFSNIYMSDYVRGYPASKIYQRY